MCKTNYNAVRIAKQLHYSEETIKKLTNAKSEGEILRILHTAREKEM